MAEDKGQGGAAAAIEDEEPAFEAPERGSADELLDAGAHAPIDAMRHSTAHVMAEAVLDLFPGAKLGIGPAIQDGFYYDFDLPRPLTPADLEAIEGRMRESIAADHAFVRKEVPFDEGRALEEAKGQSFKVEILDDLARKAAGGRHAAAADERSTSTARSSTCARARTSRRRARSGRSSCSPSPARTGGATRSGRCSSGSTARSGRRRRSWTCSCSGARRRRSATTASWASQLDLFSFHDVSPGLGVLAPQGPADLADARGRDARAPGPPRLPGGLARRSSCPSACGTSPGHWDHYAENMFIVESEGQTVQPQADELPRVDVHLPLPPALVPRPAAAPQRVRPAAPQRALGRAVRPDPRAPVHPGRRARLRPPGPADGRDRGDAGRGPRGVRLVRPRATVRVRDPARQGDRRPGPVGPGRGADQGSRWTAPAATTSSSPRTGRSTRPRSTSTSTTRWAASGRWRRSRST